MKYEKDSFLIVKKQVVSAGIYTERKLLYAKIGEDFVRVNFAEILSTKVAAEQRLKASTAGKSLEERWKVSYHSNSMEPILVKYRPSTRRFVDSRGFKVASQLFQTEVEAAQALLNYQVSKFDEARYEIKKYSKGVTVAKRKLDVAKKKAAKVSNKVVKSESA